MEEQVRMPLDQTWQQGRVGQVDFVGLWRSDQALPGPHRGETVAADEHGPPVVRDAAGRVEDTRRDQQG